MYGWDERNKTREKRGKGERKKLRKMIPTCMQKAHIFSEGVWLMSLATVPPPHVPWSQFMLCSLFCNLLYFKEKLLSSKK
jgi:hypothetical protein